ncbi:MAG: chromosome segregation protein SMC, partial [Gammaproteobacteria bacterium CG_4_9_14_3_um_filter_38_9]
MQSELRLLHAQMKALQWKNFENQLGDKKEKITQQAIQYESDVAKLRECETQIEKSRLASQAVSDEKETIQKQFYGVGAEIAKLEQQIQHKQEQITQWQHEFAQSGALWEELTQQASTQKTQIDTLTNEVTSLKPQANELQAALSEANHALAQAEQRMRESQNQWDGFQNETAKTNQQLEVAKNNIRHYEAQQQQLRDRKLQLESQVNGVSLAHLSDELSPLAQKSDELKATILNIQATLAQLSQAISQQRIAHQESQNALSQAQGELQKQEAQEASLSALQQAALQDHQGDVRAWLEKQGLTDFSQLGKMIRVDAGWECAVETVLGDYFDAICIDAIEPISQSFHELSKGQVTLLQAEKNAVARLSRKTLCDVIHDCASLPAWVSSIYVVDHLSDALQLRSELLSTESIVTREGQWVGSNWIRVAHADATEDGFLMRETQLKALQSTISAQKEKLAKLQTAQNEAKMALEKLEAKRDLEHRLFQESTAASTDAQANLSAKKSRLETLSQQQQRLQSEIQQIEAELQQCEVALATAHEMVDQKLQIQSHDATQRETLLQARSTIENELATARLDAQTKKQHADERLIRLTSSEKQLTVLSQTLLANQKQLTQINARREFLTQALAQADAPLAEWTTTLQLKLTERVTVEDNLRATDSQAQAEQANLKELEALRDRLSKSISALQEHQQQCKLAIQEMLVRQTTLTEQLTEMQFELNTLLSELPDHADASEWENKSHALQSKIDRLGPINLAAIDEFKTLSERKTYMDNQVTDLVEALEVLQNAIRKIDRETRHLFKETFDQVNGFFKQLFPRIFGGGQASLELTSEEDLLTTGILVKAQPPGKRNATIHMLSGGEKTLTAIALMFAMFQLNPAPFCVLDEVDAPLDDLNVGRYCQLIKEMSKDTQFLIISHNKVTIETADHLMGVTMQEPGVSRIVSVDMQEAVALVDA